MGWSALDSETGFRGVRKRPLRVSKGTHGATGSWVLKGAGVGKFHWMEGDLRLGIGADALMPYRLKPNVECLMLSGDLCSLAGWLAGWLRISVRIRQEQSMQTNLGNERAVSLTRYLRAFMIYYMTALHLAKSMGCGKFSPL